MTFVNLIFQTNLNRGSLIIRPNSIHRCYALRNDDECNQMLNPVDNIIYCLICLSLTSRNARHFEGGSPFICSGKRNKPRNTAAALLDDADCASTVQIPCYLALCKCKYCRKMKSLPLSSRECQTNSCLLFLHRLCFQVTDLFRTIVFCYRSPKAVFDCFPSQEKNNFREPAASRSSSGMSGVNEPIFPARPRENRYFHPPGGWPGVIVPHSGSSAN